MTTIAYIRVSTVDQNTDRQLDGVEFDKAFTDRCSGGSLERPELDRLREFVREGDTVVIHSIDRLARNIDDLRGLVAEFRQQGVNVTFVKEGLTFTADDASPMAELMLSMLGAVAQFERSMIRERQQEGIAKAKARGVYSGRKASTDVHQQVKQLLADGVSMRKIAAQVGCSLSTVQRVKGG
ncbi:recombinase family protein [Shewanella eurypsychrophilus]|uniref:Recombinase family protein n=1 Tax=Shewanella eurypsychrophilus TaxID=2593656 RepID=A0ABX6VAL1_9GAMM|nr:MULTISPECIES: recombinase family protein [Shewanella]QFU24192.1 helix-turn-helix domain-containing protein [Shewanella sp. YLB-09]QPG59397.1 recombinase family protein [Shewanella eurypsychrophilus]